MVGTLSLSLSLPLSLTISLSSSLSLSLSLSGHARTNSCLSTCHSWCQQLADGYPGGQKKKARLVLFNPACTKKLKKMFSCLASTNPSGALKTGPSLHPQFRLIFFDPAARPAVPGSARECGAGRARSNPFTHAPELKKALVGKAQTPSNYYCDYYLFFFSFLFSFLFFLFASFFFYFFMFGLYKPIRSSQKRSIFARLLP